MVWEEKPLDKLRIRRRRTPRTSLQKSQHHHRNIDNDDESITRQLNDAHIDDGRVVDSTQCGHGSEVRSQGEEERLRPAEDGEEDGRRDDARLRDAGEANSRLGCEWKLCNKNGVDSEGTGHEGKPKEQTGIDKEHGRSLDALQRLQSECERTCTDDIEASQLSAGTQALHSSKCTESERGSTNVSNYEACQAGVDTHHAPHSRCTESDSTNVSNCETSQSQYVSECVNDSHHLHQEGEKEEEGSVQYEEIDIKATDNAALHEILVEVDPERAYTLHPNERRKVIR